MHGSSPVKRWMPASLSQHGLPQFDIPPFVRWLGLGKLVWSNLQVSYDSPKPSSAPPRHALSCAACRDDCTMLRNNQVKSADLGATFVIVRCRDGR